MKIYNRKTFVSGVLMLVLGTANLAVGFATGETDFKGLVLSLALLAIGGGTLPRSFSASMAREDKIAALDERNRFVALKSQSRAFRLTQGVVFVLMLIMLLGGKTSGAMELVGIGVGLAFAFSVSMFAEVFSYLYDNAKN